jgi:hypothetical protein
MKNPTNENLIPKWIADLFRTKNRSKQEQLKLDRYVADLRMRDPRKHEKLQSILKHIDPDTGHLPTGLNTAGSIDENVHDMVRRGFKTWTYTHPETGKEYMVKGASLKDIKDYLKDMHDVEVSSVLPSQLSKESSLGDANPTIRAIYNKNYQPISENKKSNKMKVNVLKQIIREEIASVMNENSDSSEFVAAVAALKNLSMIERSDFKRFIEWFEKAKEYNPSGIGKMSAQELVAAKNSADRDKELDDQYDF